MKSGEAAILIVAFLALMGILVVAIFDVYDAERDQERYEHCADVAETVEEFRRCAGVGQ